MFAVLYNSTAPYLNVYAIVRSKSNETKKRHNRNACKEQSNECRGSFGSRSMHVNDLWLDGRELFDERLGWRWLIAIGARAMRHGEISERPRGGNIWRGRSQNYR